MTEDQSHSSTPPLSAAELSAAFARMMGIEPSRQSADGSDDDSPSTLGIGEPPAGVPEVDAGAEPKRIVEAILFVGDPSSNTLSAERIAEVLRGVDAAEVREFIAELNSEYADGGHPYRIRETGSGYRIELRDEFRGLRRKYEGGLAEVRLGNAAVESLAAISYRPGITAKQLNELRGKSSGAVLKQLTHRQLIRVQRDADKPREARYFPTSRLLDLLGLEDWIDLPTGEDWEP
jgi:segregation and condensation protein B